MMEIEITNLYNCRRIKIDLNDKSKNYGILLVRNRGGQTRFGGYSKNELSKVIDDILFLDDNAKSNIEFENDLRNRGKESGNLSINGLTENQYETLKQYLKD